MKKLIKRISNQGYISTWLEIPKTYIGDAEGAIKRALTIELKKGRDKEFTDVLHCYKETETHLFLPQHFWDAESLPIDIVDVRPKEFNTVDFETIIKLDHELTSEGLVPTGLNIQKEAVEEALKSSGGIIQLACGRGKTVVAIYLAYLMRVPFLVMLDNTYLLHQWQESLKNLLKLKDEDIGHIHGGKKDWFKKAVLATYHSVANWSDTMPSEIRRYFGLVIWDEGHHISAPTFSKTASLFYGKRISLTATPQRADGTERLAKMHIGDVVYKFLLPQIKTQIGFYYTGIGVEGFEHDVEDITGNLHTKKLYNFFGSHLPRLHLVVNMVRAALNAGRKVLVTSDSVEEVVNLASILEFGAQAELLSDVPYPSSALEEIDNELSNLIGTNSKVVKKREKLLQQRKLLSSKYEGIVPSKLSPKDLRMLKRSMESQKKIIAALGSKAKRTDKQENKFRQAHHALNSMRPLLLGHELYELLDNQYRKRKEKKIKTLVGKLSSTGVITYAIPIEERVEMIKTHKISFAVTKYGKEGLDCPDLDTIIVSSMFSDRGWLQQFIGRTGRKFPCKKKPTMLVLVDHVGMCIGMSKKLHNFLRDWPEEEGGPYIPTFFNSPNHYNDVTFEQFLTRQ